MCRMVSFEGDKKVADIKLRHIKNIAEQASTADNINRIVLLDLQLKNGAPNVRI